MTDQMLDEQEPTAWDRVMARHEQQLAVGAGVRVQLNGECERDWCRGRNGQTGKVVMVLPAPHGSHRFLVELNGNPGACVVGTYFCSAELVVLLAADPDEDGED